MLLSEQCSGWHHLLTFSRNMSCSNSTHSCVSTFAKNCNGNKTLGCYNWAWNQRHVLLLSPPWRAPADEIKQRPRERHTLFEVGSVLFLQREAHLRPLPAHRLNCFHCGENQPQCNSAFRPQGWQGAGYPKSEQTQHFPTVPAMCIVHTAEHSLFSVCYNHLLLQPIP